MQYRLKCLNKTKQYNSYKILHTVSWQLFKLLLRFLFQNNPQSIFNKINIKKKTRFNNLFWNLIHLIEINVYNATVCSFRIGTAGTFLSLLGEWLGRQSEPLQRTVGKSGEWKNCSTLTRLFLKKMSIINNKKVKRQIVLNNIEPGLVTFYNC